MKLKLIFLLLIFQISQTLVAQNIGVNNPSPDASSILDLTSTSRGFLLPRMNSAQRAGIAAPATSLLVFDVTLGRFMFYNGSSWNGLLVNGSSWETIGNTGTTPGTNFLGTIDKKDVVFKSFNTEVMRIDTNLAVGIGQTAPDIKSILHVTSTTKGVLLPRMNSAQRTTLIANGSATDAVRDGMLVYDTNLKNFLSWNAVAQQWDTVLTKNNGSGLYWALLGNSGTNPATNFVGTIDSTDLVFRTNNRERFRIKANGLFYTGNQGPGASNIYMGGLAGQLTTTGSNNAGFGLQALQNNLTGTGNSALGSFALLNNTSGSENTAVGIESLRGNTTGYGNTSVGERSGYNNTTAYGNTSIGRYAIYNNTIGLENVGIGDSVLFGTSVDVGDFNVAVGNRVLFSNAGLRNVGIGYRALRANITGNDNVGIGTDALFQNVAGISNVGIGTNASYGVNGDYNVSVGLSTLFNARNATADYNVAIGYQALFTDTIPVNNVSIGSYSMYNGNQRSYNVAVGYDALRGAGAATVGVQNNVAIGYNAGRQITTGDDNVFAGTLAGQNNTTGYSNVFIGNYSGLANTTGFRNVFIGNQTGRLNSTDSYNVFIGDSAGYTNAGGTRNVMMGYQAGRSNTTADNNVFIGTHAGYTNTTSASNVFIGNLAGESSTSGLGSNVLIGNAAGQSNTTGYLNALVGYQAGDGVTTGGQNAFLGGNAGLTITTGSFNTMIGSTADVTAVGSTNRSSIGFGAVSNANNKMRLGDVGVTVIEGQPLNYTGISDGRFKKNLAEDVHGLDFILKLRPVSYNFDKITYNAFLHKHQKDYKPSAEYLKMLEDQGKTRQAGFVAQEMEEARIASGFNAFDAVAKPEDENGTWGIAYGTLVVPLVKSVQELNAKNSELERQNTELKNLFEQYKSQSSKEIEELKKIVESLKAKIEK